MLLKHDVLEAIESGRVDVVYRRWAQPRVGERSTLRTAIGVLEVVSVGVVDPGALDVGDALGGRIRTRFRPHPVGRIARGRPVPHSAPSSRGPTGVLPCGE